MKALAWPMCRDRKMRENSRYETYTTCYVWGKEQTGGKRAEVLEGTDHDAQSV